MLSQRKIATAATGLRVQKQPTNKVDEGNQTNFDSIPVEPFFAHEVFTAASTHQMSPRQHPPSIAAAKKAFLRFNGRRGHSIRHSEFAESIRSSQDRKSTRNAPSMHRSVDARDHTIALLR